MNITIVGINHKTLSIEGREQLYLTSGERELLLSELKSDPAVCEAFILSTCNRTEVYAVMLDSNAQRLLQYLFAVKKIEPTEQWKKHFYVHHGRRAAEHLLRVCCGLDSLILG